MDIYALLRRAGYNLNDVQIKVLKGFIKKTIDEGGSGSDGGGSGDGGDGSNITEITEQNVEEAVNATAFIVVKIGIDPYLKEEINENEYGYNLSYEYRRSSRYYLFYAVTNNNIVALPISLLHHFIIKGKPIIGTKNYYKVASYYNDGDKNWNKIMSFVNVNEKTFTVDEGNGDFSDAVYINSEIISLSIELSNFPKFNNDGNFNESDFYNYRLVSNDFEGKLEVISVNEKISYLDSEYIRSERFNNGLVGINNGITKSLLNINNNFISIGNINYTNYKGIDFAGNYTDGNSTNYFNFTTMYGQLKGYNISGDYTLSAQFDLRLYSHEMNFFYNFDNWAITKDNIAGFINMMVTNKVTEDLGYAAYEFYNFQLIFEKINSYDTDTYGYHVIDNNGNLLNITNYSQGGYYFILCGNTVDPSDSIYELVFVNIENETFENGELLLRPILIMWKKQENA